MKIRFVSSLRFSLGFGLQFSKSFSSSFMRSSCSFSKNTPSSQSLVSNFKAEFSPNLLIYTQLFGMRTLLKKRHQFESKNVNYKMKNRKSLRRRVRIVGPSYNRHFLFHRANIYHKRSKKSNANRKKERYKLMSMSNRRFCTRNIPEYKRKRCKLGRKSC